jgi:hypothetical protein
MAYCWNWIAEFNDFSLEGTILEDLWLIDSCILSKDKFLVELIRSAVSWVL